MAGRQRARDLIEQARSGARSGHRGAARAAGGGRPTPAVQLGTFQVSTRPLLVGAALIGAGTLIGLAGMVISGSVVLAATRRWVDQMETPPSELARQQWEKARAATLAGASAWQNGVAAESRNT